MTSNTTKFNKIYELLYIKGIKNPKEEQTLSKYLLSMLDNKTLDKNLLLKCIEKEDYYRLRFSRPIKELTATEKQELIDEHIDFIVTSCCTILNN